MFEGRLYACQQAILLAARMSDLFDEAALEAGFDPYGWNARVVWAHADRRYRMNEYGSLLTDIAAEEPTWALFSLEDDDRAAAYVDVKLEGDKVSIQPHGFHREKSSKAAAVIEEWLIRRGAYLIVSTTDFKRDSDQVEVPHDQPTRLREELERAEPNSHQTVPEGPRSMIAWVESHPVFIGLAGTLLTAIIAVIAIIAGS